MPNGDTLDRSTLRRTLRLSVLDAAAYAFMVGLGEVYFLADAIRLGATPFQQGLVISLPLFVGSAGPVLALRLLRTISARRPIVACAALGQALILACLALGDVLGFATPARLIALVAAYQVFGQAAGSTWSSWFGDLVPQRIRGRYFSRRNRAAHASTCLGLFVGGLVLHFVEPGTPTESVAGGGVGFALLFGLACLARLASVALLSASAEPRFRGLSTRVRVMRYFRSERGSNAWRLVVLVGVLQFAVYIAAPYFSPYMLEELHFSYLEYMAASVTVIVAKVAFLPAWGRLIDQFGARPLCMLAALLLAVVPLPWLWAGGLGWVMFAQAFSGFSWAGFEVAEFTLLLESTYRGTRLQIFAALSVATGLGQLLGGLIGATLASRAVEITTIFGISLVARVCAATALSRLLPRTKGVARVGHRDLLLRIVGIRPNGVVYRPVTGPPPSEEDVEASARALDASP